MPFYIGCLQRPSATFSGFSTVYVILYRLSPRTERNVLWFQLWFIMSHETEDKAKGVFSHLQRSVKVPVCDNLVDLNN
jgi:hypothetical protein